MQRFCSRSTFAAIALALTLVAACARQPATEQQPETPPAGETSPTETTPTTETTSTETSPSAQSAEGAIGQPVTVGTWTITVRSAEDRDEVDGVTASQGSLLRVEVDVRNTGDTPFGVQTADWRLLAGGTTYAPVRTQKPEERGERTVGAQETEDVKVSFDVPSGLTDPVLVFAPEGADAVARVRLR